MALRIIGSVRDAGTLAPLSGARVQGIIDNNLIFEAITDEHGEFHYQDQHSHYRQQSILVRVRHPGYESGETEIWGGGEAKVDFSLAPVASQTGPEPAEERRAQEERRAEEERQRAEVVRQLAALLAEEERRQAEVMAGRATTHNGTRGSILWNPPDLMKVDRRERIEVRIADINVAVEVLREGLRGRGVPQSDELEIAPLMRVELRADPKHFSIQTLSTPDQALRRTTVVRWDFDVTPLRGGLHWLRLLASMRVKVEGKDEVIDLPSYESEVRVRVAPFRAVGQFCVENWKWIAGTVAIPVVVWAATGIGVGPALLKYVGGWLAPR
jgi:hypothetical protein